MICGDLIRAMANSEDERKKNSAINSGLAARTTKFAARQNESENIDFWDSKRSNDKCFRAEEICQVFSWVSIVE